MRKQPGVLAMNEKMLQLLNGAEDKYPHILEKKFPHVFARILELWKVPAMEKYFTDLMMDTRDGKRKGFPPDAAMEVFNLSLLYDKQRTKPASQATDVWLQIPDVKKPAAK